MDAHKYLSYLTHEIHSTVMATVDSKGLLATCAIDIMDCDISSLYFLTAKGKNLYTRLRETSFLALTGMKGADTLSCISISVRGKVRELGPDMLPRLFEKNPYMVQIYPNEASRSVLTVFQLYEGTGEWFDLSRLPVERLSFSFGGAAIPAEGYEITGECTNCGLCLEICPQKCIEMPPSHAVIQQSHCIRCGKCQEICPANAVIRK